MQLWHPFKNEMHKSAFHYMFYMAGEPRLFCPNIEFTTDN